MFFGVGGTGNYLTSTITIDGEVVSSETDLDALVNTPGGYAAGPGGAVGVYEDADGNLQYYEPGGGDARTGIEFKTLTIHLVADGYIETTEAGYPTIYTQKHDGTAPVIFTLFDGSPHEFEETFTSDEYVSVSIVYGAENQG